MMRLILADASTIHAATVSTRAWSARHTMFEDATAAAKAAAEFALNEMGLTMFKELHDDSLFKYMDDLYAEMDLSSKERWCRANPCGCIGCANALASTNNISKQQHAMWVQSRRDRGLV